ncbi:MAG: FtsW/RodA/SpoVE family cell cycle protein [Pseudomonadales bacterium]|nr:FtsW/RodA/SpoVE family cell cycle protein [Pseudomonadales bacterium]
MHRWFLPALLALFALLSLSTLMGIDEALAFRQAVFYAVGFAVFFIVQRIPTNMLLRYSPFLWLGVVGSLVATLLLASTTRGTTRWIAIGDVAVFQPSQFAVLCTMLVVIWYTRTHSLKKWKHLLVTLALVALPTALIMIEPDLDTTIVFAMTLGVTIWARGITAKQTTWLISILLISSVLSWVFVLREYQKERVYSFVAGSSQETERHYNAQQALIAIGAGGVAGTGVGEGGQSHLKFLPERQTDFIFSAIAEEYGFIGALLVVSMYALLIGYCFYLFFYHQETDPSLIALTTGALILFQAGVNISMNIGLIPIAGLTLPFLSAGGSSLIALCILLGVVHATTRNTLHKQSLHIA